ncbi:hypothetical protein ABZX30_22455 [Streptomyces sp. NPDC004542]|uniref:hypothetical protein n=1 Tax=Streptomyces sp. NPDC004542 TaxID=3154281 RepID=UPI0033AA4233
MSGLGELGHPGTPGNPGAWDARSQKWSAGERPTPGATATPDATGRLGAAPEPELPYAAERPQPGPVREAGSDALHRREDGAGGAPRSAARRGAADPVKALMHRHRRLCERSVDPLEIAAGLEAHGVTDRTAARFRHRDVFSLAEEMFARASRDGDGPPPADTTAPPRTRPDWALLTLLPGALGTAVVTALRLTHGRPRLLVAAAGFLALALAVRAALRRGPLSTPAGPRAWRTATRTRASTVWLLAYALLGDGLLRAVLDGGPDHLPTGAADGPWPLATAPVLALVLGCAPAAWCAHLFAVRTHRGLTASSGLEEFAAATRPALFGTFALFLAVLTALLALCGAALHQPAAYPQALTLGALLLLARLLTVHRHRHAPAMVLAVAAGAEAAASALDLTGRLPGCAFLAAPVESLVGRWGPGSVPTLACGTAALVLLVHAGRTLTRASAHAPTEDRTGERS